MGTDRTVRRRLGRKRPPIVTYEERARQYLEEGSLRIVLVDGPVVLALCSGLADVYRLGREPGRGWWCSCNRTSGCPHIMALQLAVGDVTGPVPADVEERLFELRSDAHGHPSELHDEIRRLRSEVETLQQRLAAHAVPAGRAMPADVPLPRVPDRGTAAAPRTVAASTEWVDRAVSPFRVDALRRRRRPGGVD